jgi:hypothetical protein
MAVGDSEKLSCSIEGGREKVNAALKSTVGDSGISLGKTPRRWPKVETSTGKMFVGDSEVFKSTKSWRLEVGALKLSVENSDISLE